MRIGCDLDGTVFMTYERMKETYKRTRGKEFNLELILDFNLVWNPFDKLWLYNYFRSQENYRNIETYPDSIYSILKLKEVHEIYFITIRPPLPEIQAVTRETLKECFDIPTTNIVFCKTFEEKIQIAKDLDIKVLIEDNINSEIIPENILVILFKRIWNQKIPLNSRVTIVNSWEEVRKLIEKL